jgi:hypothetical protein
MINENALPRTYVPARVEHVADQAECLRRLGSAEFNPREIAFVDRPANAGPVRGTAEIVRETPTTIEVVAKMETPGVVVLADLWNTGWRATVAGENVEILRVNHALRGVALQAG